MSQHRLLLVEDEAGLVLTLTDRFRREGYLVEHAGDGRTGLERATGEAFDLVILDVMLPHLDGFEVCRQLRHRGVDVPVIMLTARGHVADRVSGLKLGADDYLTKPFEMVELLARVEARLRRRAEAPGAGQQEVRFGEVAVDFRRAEVIKSGSPVDLSAREFRLLQYLVEHRGATVSREELLREVWGYDSTPLTRTVDVHIAWLRQKLEPNPRRPVHILTIHGLGYKFVA
jgi:two-component system, OmpR family, alkaline phosphatase synthesis response regulator PhoP